MASRLSPPAVLILAWLALGAAGGCTTTITPPVAVSDPVTVYIPDYGRHASLILPDGGGYVEYAYGEWSWFAEGRDSLLRGPAVLLLPGQATLGRLDRPPPPAGGRLAAWASAAEVHELVVERYRAEALRASLDERFRAAIDTRVEGFGGMHFVKDPSAYHGLRNSNTVVAEWLRQLGATVRGPAIFSSFDVRR